MVRQIKSYFNTMGFSELKIWHFPLHFPLTGKIIYLLVYVDDILLTGNDELLLNKLASDLNKEFVLKKLGQIHYFLGIEAYRDATGLCLTQSKYMAGLLKKHQMENVKPCPTPMIVGKASSERR